mmetsp:Transcript_122342/g.193783  ORF Transcript_122342/g.193783 Transcript_122342/m.193783 type:complete len:260 (+) Transcript_122342:59-838(+)
MHFASGKRQKEDISNESHRHLEKSRLSKKASRSRSRRKDKKDFHEEKRSKKKREKEFAWMDSEDEDSAAEKSSGSEKKESTAPSGTKSEPDEPTSASDIQSFGQMVKMAPKLQAKVRDMGLTELADVCQAAARVKFYDCSLLDALVSATKRHLRGKGRHKPADIVRVLAGLSSINSYDKSLFELIERTLAEYQESQIDAELRKQILKAMTAVGHKSEHPFILAIRDKEAAERYQIACNKSATAWQKRDENQRHRTYWWS